MNACPSVQSLFSIPCYIFPMFFPHFDLVRQTLCCVWEKEVVRDVFKNVLKLPLQAYLELTCRYFSAMFRLWPKDCPEKSFLLIAILLSNFPTLHQLFGVNMKWVSLKERASFTPPDSTTKRVFLLACGTIRSSESRVTRLISAGSFWASGWISRCSSTPYQSSLTFKAWSCGMSPRQGWGS